MRVIVVWSENNFKYNNAIGMPMNSTQGCCVALGGELIK